MSDTTPPEGDTTLAAALLAAQEEIPAVEPDQTNPHFKSKFVSLGNLIAKTKPILNRHKLVLMQAPALDAEGRFVLRTTILHGPTGESIVFDSPLTPTKNDPQGQGSAITYMRRYSLAIADQEDDDGAKAAERQQAERSPATDGESLALIAQARKLRDEIRVVDDGALPAQSFDAAMAQREHSHDRLEDFVGNLTELLADVQRFEDLREQLAGKLDESDLKKLVDRAQRRASRRERVEVLEQALAEATDKPAGGGDGGKAQ
jgi:hypothetical protein